LNYKTETEDICKKQVIVYDKLKQVITIDKTDFNDLDLDGTKLDDSQLLKSGDNAIFQITIKNT
jgi:hypothetical protein